MGYTNNYKKPENSSEEKNYNMTTVLNNKNIISLGDSLHLTEEQKAAATSSALQLSTNPALLSCDKFSLAKFCFETARYNFSRPDCIYPVPYGKYVQAQLGYRGYKELAMRSKLYKEIDAVEVLDCDKLKRNRLTGAITVEFEEDVNKTIESKVIGFYAYAIGTDGELAGSLYWTLKQCEEHGHKYSRSYDSIWGKQFTKMAKKTVLKQLLGQLPTTPDIQAAIKQDQIVYGGDGEENTYKDNPYNDEPEYTEADIKRWESWQKDAERRKQLEIEKEQEWNKYRQEYMAKYGIDPDEFDKITEEADNNVEPVSDADEYFDRLQDEIYKETIKQKKAKWDW